MNREAIAQGMVVKSMAGHDSGSYYAVMRLENGFAYIADGKRRKAEAPKKKNPLHLQKTSKVIDVTDITNKQLRAALRTFGLGADIAEESD